MVNVKQKHFQEGIKPQEVAAGATLRPDAAQLQRCCSTVPLPKVLAVLVELFCVQDTVACCELDNLLRAVGYYLKVSLNSSGHENRSLMALRFLPLGLHLKGFLL